MSISQIKLINKLAQKKYRNEFKLFVAEGLRLCEEIPPEDIAFGFFTKEFLSDERATILIERLKKSAQIEEINTATMERISDTKTPQGILLVGRQKLSSPDKVVAKKIIAVLDGVQDPGNVGTILRTAAAFDCGVILLEGSADIFNPKVIRSSMGAIFHMPITVMTCAEFLSLMKSCDVEILATALDSSAEIYWRYDYTRKPSAIIFGSEANGVSQSLLDVSEKIFIPMRGHAESLNVATATAIILSEVVRQHENATPTHIC
ncbi:MAG: RNA methyltransferase [Selenomonadaceae bacterium]|nr:RNA methyltransferase [Selenomonadaceae bacterium]